MRYQVVPLPELGLRNATGINDAGQIVGYGRFGDDEYVPFLLNPIPEPGTVWVIGLFVMLAGRRVRRTLV